MAMTSVERERRQDRPVRARLVTAGILVAFFVLAMFIRCYWYYEPAVAPAETYGDYHYVVSGNDPDYHKRTIDYILDTGHHLTWDHLMNYPIGGPNPNPPAFAWSSMLFGIVLSPFHGFDVTESVWMFFEILPAFWAAMTIFPIYFFTRDTFGRKPAYLAALFIAVMAGNVERTPLGFSDHDSYTMFFVVTGFFFLMRALKNLEDRTWVRRWRSARDISQGTTDFFTRNRVSVLYSVMAGLSIGAVMLGWKGGTYIFAILFMYFLVHAWIKRFRKEDPFGMAMVTLIAMGVPLLISFPYYYSMYFIHWYETPFFVFLATCILAVIVVVTREQPWTIVVGGLVALVVSAYLILWAFLPAVYNVLLGFQGYFIRDKLYTTIAEAQPPDFSRMVYSYGEYIFYFGLLAIIYSAWRLPKERWRNDYIFTIMWCFMAIFMAMSAVRFMYNATPVFAILGGWVTWTIIQLLDFKKMAKTYRGLNEGRWVPRWHAVKTSVKVRHVVGVFFIGYMVIGSATWYGIDAGIPYETKKDFDRDIYNILPAQLRPANYDPDSGGLWWFGSFGTAFPSDYWTDGMYWFATQDTNESPEDRPAFVAWWDYGHWCMRMGEHPSIADNFQQGVEISGNIITSQNESSAIAYYIARVAEGSITSPAVRALLERYLGRQGAQDFVDIELMRDLPRWQREILRHPEVFGKRTGDMNDLNTKWVALRGMLASTLTKRELVELYDELCHITGHEIRYFAADTRMFPFTAQNTGIYYAPVKLTDQEINDFLKTFALGNDGVEYDPAKIPESVLQDPDFRVTTYKLYYTDMFYNSMFYRAYIGYAPSDVGIAPKQHGYVDLPTLGTPDSSTMRSGQYPPMQGWNMSNFRLEYRTAYWNPYNETTGLANHSQDWKVVPPWTARKNEDDRRGTTDIFYRNLYAGVFFLKYYHGAFVNGTVRTDDGRPLAGARVTVYDDLPLAISYYPGVPHDHTVTDPEGRYSLLAPYGNVTIKVTNGGVGGVDDQLLLKDSRELGSDVFHVSDDQAMRREVDLDQDGIPDYNIVRDFTVKTSALNGRAYFDEDGDGDWTEGTDTPLSGELTFVNSALGLTYRAPLNETGQYLLQNITPTDYTVTAYHGGFAADGGTTGADPGGNDTFDVKLRNINLNGNLTLENGTGAANLTVGLLAGGEVLWSNTTSENGSYLVEHLMPGTYNVSVVTDGYYRSNVPATINQTENFTLELLAIAVHNVSGATSPGALVSFQSPEPFARGGTVTADASGRYLAKVGRGNYTVYARATAGTGIMVNITPFTSPGAPATLDLSLRPGVRINGTVYRDMNGNGDYDVFEPGAATPPGTVTPGVPNINIPEYQAGAGVELEGAAASLFLPANSLGYYEAWVPAGHYVIRAFRNVTESESYVNVTPLELSAPLTLNLSLGKGVEVSGTLYWDRNGDGAATEDEGVDGGRLILTDRKRPDRTLEASTAQDGSFVLFLPQIAEYNVSMGGTGYLNGSDFVTVGTEAIRRDFRLEPRPTAFTARLTLEGGPAPAGVVGHVYAQTPGALDANLTTNATGALSGPLLPGGYSMVVEQNVTLDGGIVNLTSLSLFTIPLGPETFGLDVALDRSVFVSGAVFHDENRDGVAQRTEYRNSLVKFIPEEAVGDPASSIEGIPASGPVRSVSTVEGRYDIKLAPGNYTVWCLLPLPTPEGPDLVHLARVSVNRTSALSIPLEPGCNVRGTLYTDLNGNGGADEGESRGGVGVAVSAGGPVLLTVASDPSGYYGLTLPQGKDFSFDINNTTADTITETESVPIRYVASVHVRTPAGKALDLNLSAVRQIGVAGRATFDLDGDGAAEAVEGVADAVVVYENATGAVFWAATNGTGGYALFLAPGTYNVTVSAPGYAPSAKGVGPVSVSIEKRLFDLPLSAHNVTVSFSVHPPGGAGVAPRIPGGALLTLRSLDGLGLNTSDRTDVNGRLEMVLPPGVYSVLSGTGDGVYFGPLEVLPSGEAVPVRLELGRPTRLWGSAYINGTAGAFARPAWVNLTFNTTFGAGGRNFTASVDFGGLPPVYEVNLPAGNFSAEAVYTAAEGRFNLTYNASRALGIGLNDTALQWDIPLSKVRDHSVGLFWDEAQKVTREVNTTLEYTLLLSNLGNDRFTMGLEVSKPGGWSVNLSLRKVDLAPGENLTVTANITVPANANAGDNIITINASSSELPDRYFNVSRLSVNIVQFYGLELKASDTRPVVTLGGMDYSVKLVNKGNGLDTFNLTVSGPHGWALTLNEYNPRPSGGESLEIVLSAKPFSGARIEPGLTARITAASAHESVPTSEFVLNLTFPRITASGPRPTGEGASEPKAVPGFEALMMLAAVGAAAAALRRRWAR
ncbi:MAG: hypothetical protein FJ149_10365 [Euryarchaeota archaeon]|nr:hypothetical protein [Euryarchaeota archaeon]